MAKGRRKATLHTVETGWRVRGRNWWLWVLGEIFLGLLVVDGWKAYLQLICE